jgi:hypothetical protein
MLLNAALLAFLVYPGIFTAFFEMAAGSVMEIMCHNFL